ncbi:hypothetical protein [Paenirhodobacter sp.]|uniref:hypothetical protein n=1 Tax=Paenirhodobacter sp. TaxID=1965326 RepID=UPI003B3EB470
MTTSLPPETTACAVPIRTEATHDRPADEARKGAARAWVKLSRPVAHIGDARSLAIPASTTHQRIAGVTPGPVRLSVIIADLAQTTREAA